MKRTHNDDCYLLGIDLGTSTLKIGIFDINGKEILLLDEEYQLDYPGENMVENDVEKYWDRITGLVRRAARSIDTSRIISLSISSQAETIVPVNRQGKPLSRAIVWLDGRTKEEAGEISKNFNANDMFRITGQPYCDPAWPATKIMWFSKNKKDIFEKTYKFLLLEDYIAFKFTNKMFGERSLYSSSYYYDINRFDYYDEMLEFLEIDRNKLPEIIKPGTDIGGISLGACNETGLKKGTRFITGALDQVAGAFGAGNIFEGNITETTGTAFAMVMTINKPFIDLNSRIPCHIHLIENKFCLLPYSTTGGMVLKWFKENFFKNEEQRYKSDIYDLMTEEAGRIKPGSDGLIMLPHILGAFIPENNPKARGVFFGIGIDHTRAHFTRAILESIGFMLRKDIELFSDMGISMKEITSLGGGAKSSLWNQIKADITGLKIQAPPYTETAILGAALMAGMGAGIYKDHQDAISRLKDVKKSYYPDSRNKKVYDQNFKKYNKIYSRLENIF